MRWLAARKPVVHLALPHLGVTLVELLVVMTVIGILVAITIPAVQSVRNASRKTACANNLRQIGLAINNYEAANQHYPPGQTWLPNATGTTAMSYAWSAHVLSYLEQQTLLGALDLKRSFLEPKNLSAASQVIPSYVCPATSLRESHRSTDEKLFNMEGRLGSGLACIDYLGIAGPSKTWTNPATGLDYGPQRGILIGVKGMEDKQQRSLYVRVRQVVDGLSKTACVTECSGRGLDKDGDYHGTWVSGKNISHVSRKINEVQPPKAWTKERIYAQHSGGSQFLFCDNSVHFFTNKTSKNVLKAICSRDGEEVGGDFF